MPEASLRLLFLGIITACFFVMTLTIVVTAGELRRALQDARRMFRQGRRLLARAGIASGHVEAVIHQACEAATGALDAIGHFRTRAQALWTKQVGNGAGAEPRQHHRGRSGQ